MCQGRFAVDIKEKFFRERVPRTVVESSSLEAFKKRVDVASGDTGQ